MHYFRRIECNRIMNAFRESFRQFLHTCFHAFRYIERIRARQLIDSNTSRRFTLQTGNHIVFLTSQLDASHILQSKNTPTVFYPKNDFTELIGRGQSPFYIQGILKSVISRTAERLSNIPCRNLHVLCLNSRIHLVGTKVTDTHRLGVQPDTHGVIACSHDIDRSHSRYTGELVHQVQVGIIGQIQSVVDTIPTQSQHHDDVR